MVFYEGSVLPVQWTSQHGCGGRDGADPHNLNCNLVLQYACDTNDAVVTDEELKVELRDGANTNQPDAPGSFAAVASTALSNRNAVRGRHESEASYLSCATRPRNRGLFLADRVRGDKATSTRQQDNTRRGLECQEERDYYPYWRANMWRDVAYITSAYADKSNVDVCSLVQKNSQNNNIVYKCSFTNAAAAAAYNETECTQAGGTWIGHSHSIPAPDCVPASWNRDNHLGDTPDANYANYTWTLPTFDGAHNFAALKKYGPDNDMVKCVIRLRYNISTDDYDPWNTDWRQNQVKPTTKVGFVKSPVTENPTVDIGADLQGLKLAINTAQYGRTFQDRSHVFYIKKRPASLVGRKIYNLNVRGKRGNIVQTYPAVEYDFVPQTLNITKDDIVHVQWTGSNTHNNGGDGGDGQPGDDGEGTGGTDRNNMALTMSEGENFPMPLDKGLPGNLWQSTNCYDLNGNKLNNEPGVDATTCPLILATSGFYRTVAAAKVNPSQLQVELNNAPASLIGGVVLSFTAQSVGKYSYVCTRNNNFSNRSQKGVIFIRP